MKNYQSYLIILLLALIPVVNGGYTALTLTIIIFGILHLSKLKLSTKIILSSKPAILILISLVIFGVSGVAFGVLHNHKIGHFEAFIPFILSPLIMHGFLQIKSDENTLWIGSAFAAIFGVILAISQTYHMNIYRAYGGLKNPIIFGNICIVFASISLIGILATINQAHHKIMQSSFLLLGFISGVYASLLSGSKGGWISIFTSLIIFIWLWLKDKRYSFKIGALMCAICCILILFYIAPSGLVKERLLNGIRGGIHWFQTGEVTEGSVSIRLDLWKAGLQMYFNSPNNWLLGLNSTEIEKNLTPNLLATLKNLGGGMHLESDLIHTLVTNGLIGLLIKFNLLISIFYAFIKLKISSIKINMYTALVGSLLIILYFEFGLSVLIFGHNSFRHVFVLLTLLSLSLIIKRQSTNNLLSS